MAKTLRFVSMGTVQLSQTKQIALTNQDKKETDMLQAHDVVTKSY